MRALRDCYLRKMNAGWLAERVTIAASLGLRPRVRCPGARLPQYRSDTEQKMRTWPLDHR